MRYVYLLEDDNDLAYSSLSTCSTLKRIPSYFTVSSSPRQTTCLRKVDNLQAEWLTQNLLQSCYAKPSLYASNAVKLRVDRAGTRRLKSAHLKIVWKAVLESSLTTWEDSGAESITRLSTVHSVT